MEFLAWHYTQGLQFYIESWAATFNWIIHYFSLALLLKTLFMPWKRLIEVDKTPGFNFEKAFRVFTFNLISRGIGAVVRIILFWTGLILILMAFLAGVSGLIFWTIMPFFGLSVYKKYKGQPKIFVADLMDKIRISNKNPLDIVFNNEAGRFILSHIGFQLDEIINASDPQKISFKNFNPETYADIIRLLIKEKVWKEDFFNKKDVGFEDLELSAGWWDSKKNEETKLGEANLGRPGIALELTFGYTPTLNQYSVDLSIPQSYSHRLIGRQQIVSRMERILTSGQSIVLMGQPGVGKKTVVLEFARRAASGQLGPKMSYKRILEFDHNSLLSEASDVNKKKTRLAEILAEAAYAGNIILMIRDIQRLTNSEVEGYDFTDVFEQYLEKKDLKIIAMCANADYERFIASNMRLRKYLEKVEVIPPTKDEALQIIVEAAARWEKLGNLTITVGAIRNILEESDRFVTDVPFPEKALELLDAVVTYNQQKGDKIVTIEDTNAVLGEKTGISFAKLTPEEKKRLGDIEKMIHSRLVNQNIAVDLIGKTLRAKTIGVIKEKRPLGSFLFLGPTGVGKTETAKVLAEVYYGSEENILRFDMAEYSGREGLERLIGSISKNQPGSLTTAIKNRPASLLLLDEIEKASREIYNLFLVLLDEGVMTDAFGKKIGAGNLFVIGTSNAGAEYIRQLVGQGVRGEELQKKVVNFVLEKEIFSPEFLNRFDGVVVYEPLSKEHLIEIAKLMLSDLRENLKKKNIELVAGDDVAFKLAEDGFDPAFGARPMRRIVNITLGDLIGKSLIQGTIEDGDNIKIVAGQGKEEFFVKKVV